MFRTGAWTVTTAAALGLMIVLNPAQAEMRRPKDPVCTVAAPTLDQVLTRTQSRLMENGTLTVVAIGSSSTEGAGASSSSASYPSRLEALLKMRFPAVTVRVINRGVGGEEEPEMLARFDRDVIAEEPDLVLWQVASNAIMRDRSVSALEALIREGIKQLKQSGADTVLIDPQYTTAMLDHTVALPMVDLVAAQARRQDVAIFRRFELMQNWRDKESIPFEAFSISDGLHMNDWGYDCLARNLEAAIVEAAKPAFITSKSW